MPNEEERKVSLDLESFALAFTSKGKGLQFANTDVIFDTDLQIKDNVKDKIFKVVYSFQNCYH